MKVLYNFIWSRVFIAVGKYMSVFDTRVKAVAGGTVVSGLGGIYEGSYPHGNLIWIGCMMGLLALDKLGQQYDNSATRALTVLGFVTRRNDIKDQ
ncbi:hypothetical protein DER45DRAFT_557731 [Fusarium avenaceum]|nr:hypothetical protein DER45DRAFT_557731 [Fusarium avenaceum]